MLRYTVNKLNWFQANQWLVLTPSLCRTASTPSAPRPRPPPPTLLRRPPPTTTQSTFRRRLRRPRQQQQLPIIFLRIRTMFLQWPDTSKIKLLFVLKMLHNCYPVIWSDSIINESKSPFREGLKLFVNPQKNWEPLAEHSRCFFLLRLHVSEVNVTSSKEIFTYILNSTEMVPSSRNYWESELIEVNFGYGLDLIDRFFMSIWK